MSHVGRITSKGGAAVQAVVALFLMAGAAQAQVVQTIDFSASQLQGAWASGGCGTGNERGTSTGGANMDMTWTDTTGATDSGVVQIEIQANWKFFCSGGGYTLSVNGTALGNGTQPSNNNNCNCNASPFETTTQTIGPGTFPWTPGESNTLTWTCSGGSWIGVMDNGQSWSIRVIVTMLNQPPDVPANAVQIGPDGKTIPVGGTCKGTTVRLRATMADPDNDACYMEAEFQPITYFFQGLPNYGGNPAPAGQDAFVDVTNLIQGSYHWQVRAVDPFAFISPWVSFGGNSEVTADVVVDTSLKPPAPIDGKNHGGGDCDVSVGGSVGFLSPALLGLALLGLAFVRRRR